MSAKDYIIVESCFGAPYQAQDGSYRQQPPKSAPVPQQPNMFPPQQSNADGNDDLPF